MMNRLKEITLPALVASIVLAIEVRFVKPWPVLGDASYYYAMAKDPLVFITPKGYAGDVYGYRILTPWLVHFFAYSTRISIDDGFRILTLVSIFLTSMLLIAFLRKIFELSLKQAVLGEFLFLTDIVIIYNLANFRLVDPLAYLFLILGLFFIYERKDVPFIVTTALAMLNKEIQLILIPMYYIVNLNLKLTSDIKFLFKVFFISIPAISVFVILRFTFSSYESFSWLPWFEALYANILRQWHTQAFKSIGLFIFSWSFLWILALLGYLKHSFTLKKRERSLIYLLALVLPLAVPFDISRMLAYAFPTIITYSLFTISALLKTKVGKILSTFIISFHLALQIALTIFVLPK